jgi:uncharacterized protein
MKALIVRGGWEGHEPKPVSEHFAAWLRESGVEVEISDTLDVFKDEAKVGAADLIVPVWTMGKIEGAQLKPLLNAVRNGAGIGGVHGGMCDAFREQTEYQFMCGGQWVAHPGGAGVTYTVRVVDHEDSITKGVKDFSVTSEQYYMHVDPGNKVLAVTDFGNVVMPVVWTKMYGKGRVFYCSVGHIAKDVQIPEARTMITRGLLWAAQGKALAK